MTMCYQGTDEGSGFVYCLYRADCNDPMDLSFESSVNLAALATQAPGLRVSVSINRTSTNPMPTLLDDSAPGSGGGTLSFTVALKGDAQSVINHVASFGMDLIEFEARNGRIYTIEREGLLPLYNLYVNDMVVDSIWVD